MGAKSADVPRRSRPLTPLGRDLRGRPAQTAPKDLAGAHGRDRCHPPGTSRAQGRAARAHGREIRARSAHSRPLTSLGRDLHGRPLPPPPPPPSAHVAPRGRRHRAGSAGYVGRGRGRRRARDEEEREGEGGAGGEQEAAGVRAGDGEAAPRGAGRRHDGRVGGRRWQRGRCRGRRGRRRGRGLHRLDDAGCRGHVAGVEGVECLRADDHRVAQRAGDRGVGVQGEGAGRRRRPGSSARTTPSSTASVSVCSHGGPPPKLPDDSDVPAGTASVTVTSRASDGPALVTIEVVGDGLSGDHGSVTQRLLHGHVGVADDLGLRRRRCASPGWGRASASRRRRCC